MYSQCSSLVQQFGCYLSGREMIILFTLKRFCITEYSPDIIFLCFVNGELTFGSCLNNYPLKVFSCRILYNKQ